MKTRGRLGLVFSLSARALACTDGDAPEATAPVLATDPADAVAPPSDGGAALEAEADGGVDANAPNIVASASGTVEVFVNGLSLGRTNAPGAELVRTSTLPSGENVIVLRATKGGASAPFAVAEIGGVFGKARTSARWKAKAATAAESTEPVGAWAKPDFDDTAWSRATEAASKIWTANAGDDVVLLRLRLYVPPGFSADVPVGFGHAVTGGLGGPIVDVATTAELAQAVAGTTPRIVRVNGTIDFTGTEGPITSQACVQAMQCPAPMKTEYIEDILGYCDGKPTFAFTYDKAGTKPLVVGSNKTIIGAGVDATIKGKGLTVSGGAQNVVIRNLTISDINPQIVWGGDAIHLDDADGVWIDHVRIARIARQMLVTGKGKATNVTFSWNELDGRTPYASFCDGAHYWAMLLVAAPDSITVNDNWIHDTSGRGPHAGGLPGASNTGHFVNDYYENVPGQAVEALTSATNLRFEGTYFENVRTPFKDETDPGHVYAPLGSNVGKPVNGSFPVDQAALSAFANVPAAAVAVPYPAEQVPNAVPHLAGPGHIRF